MARQTVLLDNCAWDKLRNRGVDLVSEQGNDLFFTTSVYGLQEIPPADHEREDARATSAYAHDQLESLKALPVEWFGLGDANCERQDGAGFGDLLPDGTVSGGGYLTSVEGRAYFHDDSKHKKIGGESGVKPKGSGLLSNLTDVDYGEWSMGIPVVTGNAKDFKNAGKVIDLSGWVAGTFGDFVRSELAKFGSSS